MRVPSINLDELRNWINILRGYDLSIVELNDVISTINNLFNYYAKVSIDFSFPKKIYRAVKRDKCPTNINQLIHPKPELIKKFGRCNDIGISYFYGCFHWEPTLFELRVKEGDYIVLSLFSSADNLNLMPIGYSKEAFEKLNSSRMPPSEAKPSVTIELLERDSNKVIDNFIDESFTKIVDDGEEYKYKTSVAISKWIMSNEFIDGIIYPSILMKANSDNIALKSESAFRKLQLINTAYAKVGKNNGLFFEIIPELISNRFALNGDIFWAKINSHKIENGQTVFEGTF